MVFDNNQCCPGTLNGIISCKSSVYNYFETLKENNYRNKLKACKYC